MINCFRACPTYSSGIFNDVHVENPLAVYFVHDVQLCLFISTLTRRKIVIKFCSFVVVEM